MCYSVRGLGGLIRVGRGLEVGRKVRSREKESVQIGYLAAVRSAGKGCGK